MNTPDHIIAAQSRIAGFVHRTPLMESGTLNAMLGHRIVFKCENLQKIGAFKVRGAMNTLLTLKEQGAMPERVTCFSSGNHAQAVAYGAKILGLKATIFIPQTASSLKVAATRAHGAEVVVTKTRQEAESAVQAVIDQGAVFIHPYDDDRVMAGQGTAALEAFQDGPAFSAVFAPCGGGGLVSGTWLAAQATSPETKVFGVEPLNANDAARTLRDGKIFKWEQAPDTIADGVRTLYVSERTLAFLKQTAGVLEVSEDDIIYWTQWLTHLLKLTIEPTSAGCMAGVVAYLRAQTTPQTVLVILSGGNVAPETQAQIWAEDRLGTVPCL
ncbi:serine/threonine dehydratase [Asticcacaulis endophyticus]|uniref:Serine/threonine dehydratase n=1 Tax=Asticcacaulis endophyticus TaxID=1395890 RepID=A0A918UP60_9CAUL|nr:serine/threonine dehydratase [Asticcacaulis endophyticus]GGZ24395.1 serine/threonine dehydratase [Asticcacaulis endophyticus]